MPADPRHCKPGRGVAPAPRAADDGVQALPVGCVPAGPPGGTAPWPRPQWTSQQLLGSAQEIEILHAGSVYRLRLTAMGKLILTK